MIPRQYLFYSLGGFAIFFMFIMWTNTNYQNQANSLWSSLQPKKSNESEVATDTNSMNETEVVTNTQSINGSEISTNMISMNGTKNLTTTKSPDTQQSTQLKHILIWTMPRHDPLMYLGEGQGVFIKKKCPVTNCFVTVNKKLLKEITDYDVLLFNIPEIHNRQHPNLPTVRSPHQLYVFASIESSDYYSVCDNRFDNYFNLTWTYKLNSDIFYGYMIIRNKQGEIIGPSETMHWEKLQDMTPIDEGIKEKLKNKKIAAAWIVSNCNAPSGRDNFVKTIQKELAKYNMVIDIYGNCGTISCPRPIMPKCLEKVENDYYFYLSFENSFSDDYVTEKLLSALNHYAVPIVYGIANYTRFLPDGVYLNALELGAEELAKQMAEIINDKERYYNFFKWRNHYSYHEVEEVPETDFHCKLCEKVNDEAVIKSHHAHEHLKDWWNPKTVRSRVCPSRIFG